VHCRKQKTAHRKESHPFELDKALVWKGWHAFRSRLATTLHAFGTQDMEIQGILRHSNVAITQQSYIKSLNQSQVSALDLVAVETENCTSSAPQSLGPVN
jgi:hypothetical protein